MKKYPPHIIIVSILILCLLHIYSTVSAFMSETHVWVAQQVLNDIDDGRVTIAIDGVDHQYAVNPTIVNALKKNSPKSNRNSAMYKLPKKPVLSISPP